MNREWTAQHLPEPCDIKVFASSGRGEWTDRDEFPELTEAIESGRHDVVTVEDPCRIVRRPQAHMFAAECVDQGDTTDRHQ